MYINNNWCTNRKTIYTHCCPDLEAMAVLCTPFYLPRELGAVLITAVYIAPDANASTALMCYMRL